VPTKLTTHIGTKKKVPGTFTCLVAVGDNLKETIRKHLFSMCYSVLYLDFVESLLMSHFYTCMSETLNCLSLQVSFISFVFSYSIREKECPFSSLLTSARVLPTLFPHLGCLLQTGLAVPLLFLIMSYSQCCHYNDYIK
jgi:hypothetical protein